MKLLSCTLILAIFWLGCVLYGENSWDPRILGTRLKGGRFFLVPLYEWIQKALKKKIVLNILTHFIDMNYINDKGMLCLLAQLCLQDWLPTVPEINIASLALGLYKLINYLTTLPLYYILAVSVHTRERTAGIYPNLKWQKSLKL